MQGYIERLCYCGFTWREAYSTCIQILKEYGMRAVSDYVKTVEEDHAVG